MTNHFSRPSRRQPALGNPCSLRSPAVACWSCCCSCIAKRQGMLPGLRWINGASSACRDLSTDGSKQIKILAPGHQRRQAVGGWNRSNR